MSTPKQQWEVQLAKNAGWGWKFNGRPNWFHRMMQRLLFGFVWTRK